MRGSFAMGTGSSVAPAEVLGRSARPIALVSNMDEGDCYRLCLDVWLECLRGGGSWTLCRSVIDKCNDGCDVLFPLPSRPEPGDVFVNL
jgi:hypothetical protein